MALTINTNVSSLNAQRNLGRTQLTLTRSLSRLSSGLRINSAKDDAAGLAISDRMTSSIRGLNQAVRNANDGISLLQTAEGALQESTNLLQRMRELAVQAASDINTASDRASIQDEVESIKSELNRIASTTEFNGAKLIDGSFANFIIQVGAQANQNISFSIGGAAATDLGKYTLTAAGGTTTDSMGTGSVAAAAADLASVTHPVVAQDVTISGARGFATVSVADGDSAYTIASKINDETSNTGVSASAETTMTLGNLSADGTVTFELSSGGSAATITAVVANNDLTNLAEQINKYSGTSGVTASLSNGALTLKQAEGKDIRIENFTHSVTGETIDATGSSGDTVTLTDGANDSTVAAGVVTLNSKDSFTASSSIAEAAGSIFDAAADVVSASTTVLVSEVDMTTQSGANNALTVIDSALETIDDMRSGMGALQNRLEATIANLQNVAENTAAARSRIMDADFAAETAELTRSQILQQSGIAMLAQANSLPQAVLALLQG